MSSSYSNPFGTWNFGPNMSEENKNNFISQMEKNSAFYKEQAQRRMDINQNVMANADNPDYGSFNMPGVQQQMSQDQALLNKYENFVPPTAPSPAYQSKTQPFGPDTNAERMSSLFPSSRPASYDQTSPSGVRMAPSSRVVVDQNGNIISEEHRGYYPQEGSDVVNDYGSPYTLPNGLPSGVPNPALDYYGFYNNPSSSPSGPMSKFAETFNGVSNPDTRSNPPVGSIPGVNGPWYDPTTGAVHEGFRGATPLVTGEGEFKTVWPWAGDLATIFPEWLGANVGGGASPFPYDLSAPINPMMLDLANFVTGGNPTTKAQQNVIDALEGGLISSLSPTSKEAAQTGLPAATPQELEMFQQSGLPVDMLPAWEAMVAAQERNLDQGRANIREEMAFTGNLAGSPFGTALTDYESQARLGQNAMLLQAQADALEAARGRQFQATSMGAQLGESAAQRRYGAGAMETDLGSQAAQRRYDMANTMLGAQQSIGQLFQGMDQAEVDRLLNEFIRTRPEYSPLLQYILNMSTFVPGVAQASMGLGGQALLSGIGAVGDIANAFTPTP